MDLSRLELTAQEIVFAMEPARAQAALGTVLPEWGSAVIGQPRALEALRMGTRIHSKGYNVHVSGAPGTGRRTAVLRVLAEDRNAAERLRDIVYVYNFESPLEPVALSLPAGGGRAFKRDLHRLVEGLKQIVALHAESAETKKAEAQASAEVESRENSLLASFEAALAADGFRPVQVETGGQAGMEIVPLVESADSQLEETSFEALQAKVAAGEYPAEAYDAKRVLWFGHMDRMKRLFAQLRRGRQELEMKLEELRNEALAPQVSAEVGLLMETWNDPKIRSWLEALKKDIVSHLFLFRGTGEEEAPRRRRRPALARYGVNVVVDREGADRVPIVIENHPSASNLFGSVESKPEDDGDTRSAYLRIRAGSFLRAAGGYLVLRAEDVIGDEEAWLRLKRALQDGRAEVQPRESPLGPSGWLKPEAVKVEVKVVMIGGESSYDVLYQTDPDFQKLFKVHAEFDSSMPLDDEGLRDYAAFARRVCEEEGLLGLDAAGLCALVEQGARIAEYRSRLSTRFGMIADLLREADYRARLRNGTSIDGAAIRSAVAARAQLSNLPEEKLGEMIGSGEIILQASGAAVGRVNGLAVHDRGYYAFGMPAVISAQVSPGEGGVINIEGESGLSGEIYDKAVLIVEGFLRSRYARDFPLAATASICFEQSYTAVEGDSASSTAVYALLSAIADIPLRQDVAVTGSINQIGQVQPVGGICEKVEGFYRICSQAGLSGTQGVMIPRRNVPNLTLSHELQDAISSGTFHIWAVSTIDEGIEVLTGMSAGRQDARGDFPADSFNGRVRRELLRMAKTVRTYLS
ncbi:MAG TPA: ATP-binding protein [Rectinemataceae bacterium]|nr:ATP-binding protein [Rectinemataceae bacterium]